MREQKPIYTPEYCETQYNVRAAIPEHPQIFARWKERSRQARQTLACALDVAYGGGPNEALDIFQARGQSRALLTFLHGSFWRALDKSDFSFIANPFVERGVTVTASATKGAGIQEYNAASAAS